MKSERIPVRVRHSTSDDVQDLVDSYAWLFAHPGTPPAEWDPAVAEARLQKLLASPSASVVLVAEADGHMVGFCSVYLDIESVRFGQRAWVEDLAVAPGYRSQGIGKQLLDQAKQWASRQGATHIELESSIARTEAHRFYEREAPSSRSICFIWNLKTHVVHTRGV